MAAIQDAAGFTAVFEAMRDSGKPAVGHHVSLDLSFSLAAFAGPLPGRWPDYKLMVQRWLPGELLPGLRACIVRAVVGLAACKDILIVRVLCWPLDVLGAAGMAEVQLIACTKASHKMAL